MEHGSPPMLVRTTIANGVAEIVMDAPPVNAVGPPLLDALTGALERAAEDPEVGAVVLASVRPDLFSAGLDLALVRDGDADAALAVVRRLYLGIGDLQDRLGKPTVAAVGGVARGAGITLAVQCDVVVADSKASFAYAEIDVGLLPGIHLVHLPRLAGRHVAFDLLFSGRPFGADEAHGLGIAARIAPAGLARETALDLARTLAAKPRAAMRLGRSAFRRIADRPTDRVNVERTIDALGDLLASAETRETIAAVLTSRAEARKDPGREAQPTP